jgi:acylphosphatase
VQGVYFRESTRKKAEQLDLTGWVRNLNDGSVSLEAFGAPEDLASLLKWLHKGPLLARVTSVNHENIPFEQVTSFTVRQ